MGRKLQIAVVFAIVAMLVAAVGAYAWDSSKADEIAEGVTIGGVDVSGLTEDEARRVVDRRLVEPLREPVTANLDGTKYRISPEKLEVASDVGGMVDRALKESREDALPTRVWRYATGGEVDVAISPQITYSRQALDDFVAKVAEAVNREPVDATIEPTTTSLNAVQGRDGVAVEEERLRSRLEAAVQAPADRTLKVPVETVEPEVTKAELAAQYPTYLTVDRDNFELRLWEDLELTKTYTIAVGAVGFETPVGAYDIQNMQVDPAWNVPDAKWAGDLAGTVVPSGSPDNPLKARWMGIYDGVGIHGTADVASLGTRASHGCIRMAVPDVIELYDQVDVGTPIYIG